MSEGQTMGKTLKIYIIEDNKQRREGIREYFQSVNRLLSGEQYDKNNDFKDCHLCFQKYQYDRIVLEEILPKKEDDENYNDYKFNKRSKWVKHIERILKTDEERILLIDFALNAKERAGLQKSKDNFSAETTRHIVDLLNEKSTQKEYIIFETVVKNAGKNIRGILNMKMTEKFENLSYLVMLGDYFLPWQPVYEKVKAISEVFEETVEKMRDGK